MRLVPVLAVLLIVSGCVQHAPREYIQRTTELANQLDEVAHSISVAWKSYQDGKITSQEAIDAFDRYAIQADTISTWVEREKAIAPPDYVNITWEEGGAAQLLKASADHFSYGIKNSNDEYKHSGEVNLEKGLYHLGLARELIELAK